MFIDTNKISEKGLIVSDSVSLDENLLIEENSFSLDDLKYHILFKRDGDRIKAKGNIKTLISLKCVRCLDNYDLKVDSNFDIILFPITLVNPENNSINSDEMEYIFYEDNRIDLVKILIEQINLFIPYNPICKPDCKGICPNCGVNLNHGKCKCENSSKELNFVFNKIKR